MSSSLVAETRVVATKSLVDQKTEVDNDVITKITNAFLGLLVSMNVDPKFAELRVGLFITPELIEQYKDLIKSKIPAGDILKVLSNIPIYVLEWNGAKYLVNATYMKNKSYVIETNGMFVSISDYEMFTSIPWDGEILPETKTARFAYVNEMLYYVDSANRISYVFNGSFDIIKFAKVQRNDINFVKEHEIINKAWLQARLMKNTWYEELVRIIAFLNTGKPKLQIYDGPGSIYEQQNTQ